MISFPAGDTIASHATFGLLLTLVSTILQHTSGVPLKCDEAPMNTYAHPLHRLRAVIPQVTPLPERRRLGLGRRATLAVDAGSITTRA